jgi:hypothetical protein
MEHPGHDPDAMRCQLTAPAVPCSLFPVPCSLFPVPCSKIAANFTGREITLVDHDINPESSRRCTAVLRPGVVAGGDVVTVSPSN